MIVKVDVDTRHGRLAREELDRRAACAKVRIVTVDDRPSPSGRGWHRRITVDPAPRTAMETVALQLLFGSDVVREAFNVQRARLVDAGEVSDFFAARWNRLYTTSGGRRTDHRDRGGNRAPQLARATRKGG